MEFEFELKIEEATVKVEFDYTPPDEGRMYYPDMSGQPPSPAQIDCVGVYWEREVKTGNLTTIDKVDVTDLMYALGYEQMIEDECFKHAEKHED